MFGAHRCSWSKGRSWNVMESDYYGSHCDATDSAKMTCTGKRQTEFKGKKGNNRQPKPKPDHLNEFNLMGPNTYNQLTTITTTIKQAETSNLMDFNGAVSSASIQNTNAHTGFNQINDQTNFVSKKAPLFMYGLLNH